LQKTKKIIATGHLGRKWHLFFCKKIKRSLVLQVGSGIRIREHCYWIIFLIWFIQT